MQLSSHQLVNACRLILLKNIKRLLNNDIKIEIDFRLIEHGSKEYEEVVKLRKEVLRSPLGLEYTQAELAVEAEQLHFAGYAGCDPVACAVLQWITPHVAKMRQVAIRPDLQRQGVGCRLVKAFEKEAAQRGANKIILHARQAAIPFYRGLDYEVTGAVFEEIGLLHQQMYKSLTIR